MAISKTGGSVSRSVEDSRGRFADKPTDIPRRGWWDIGMRVKGELDSDHVSIIASGLALYALLAVFPALAATVSIYGLFATPTDIADHLQQVAGALPPEAMDILRKQMTDLSSRQSGTLSFGLISGIVIALWSARKGMVALMTATNVAYGESEKRGFFKQLFVSLAFTVGAVIGFIAVLLFAVGIPVAIKLVPLGSATEIIVLVVRWAILWSIAVAGLAIVYRYAPARESARWRWITPGSAIAATLWLVGSLLFAIYVRNWASYGETYGAIGGVIVLLMWFYLTAYIIILGAEINAEIERQTKKDTTKGQPERMGNRGAYAADTVGESTRHSAG
jgi:membrane protein